MVLSPVYALLNTELLRALCGVHSPNEVTQWCGREATKGGGPLDLMIGEDQ